MATSYENPFAPTSKNVINFTFPFQRVLEKIPKGTGMDYVSEGAPSTPVKVTPKTSAIKKTVDPSAARYAAMQAAAKAGAKNPTQAGTAASKKTTGTGVSTGGVSGGGSSGSIYDLLKVNTGAVYNPILDYIKKQEAAAKARYATNSAELKNIFGALTGIDAADKARINEQFTQALTQSQTGFQGRVASEKEALAAGLAQAKATGAERGLGPEMAVNPITTATAESQSRANEYQTTWENLQRVNQAQATADVSARTEGYNYQQVAALKDLQNSLENRLMELSGQTANVQSQAAQAQLGVEQNIANAKYSNAVAAQQAAAAAAAAASKPKTYSATISGFSSKVNDKLGSNAYAGLLSAYDSAYSAATKKLTQTQQMKGTQPTKAQVLAAYRSMPGYGGAKVESYMNEYVSKYSGLK